MGLAPQTRQAGRAAQASTQQQQPKVEFRPIVLNSGQSFPLPGEPATKSGVIFTGHTAYFDDLDKTMNCGSEYCLRNTLHNGIAGVTEEGRLIFGVNSRFNGKYATVMGAFDVAGKPVPPTLKEQKLLGNLLPNSENRLVLGTKSGNDIGFQTKGTNPSGGVYIGDKKITYDLGANFAIGDDSSVAVDASLTTGFNRHDVLNQSLGLKGQTGDLSVRAAVERSGQTMTHTLEAKKGRYFANGKHVSDGVNRTREYNVGMNVNKSVTLTATFRPDYKPPSMAPAPTYRHDPFKPEPIPDHSNAKLEVKIVF